MKKLLLVIVSLFCSVLLFAQQDIRTIAPGANENSIIAVCMSTSHDNYVTANFPEENILRMQSFADLVPILRSGKADFIMYDAPPAKVVMAENPDLVVVNEKLFEDGIGVAFRHDSQALQQEFNAFLAEFVESDTYKDIVQRWLIDTDGGVIPEIEIPASGKPLPIGVCALTPPHTLIKDGEVVGFEVEIIRHFAKECGYSLEISDYTFPVLINALSSGRADLILGSISITEERKKSILFSDPYDFSIAQVLSLKKTDAAEEKYLPFIMPHVYASNGDTPSQEDSIRSIMGKGSIATVEGTIQEVYISGLMPTSQVNVAKDYSDIFLMLATGNADYVIANIGTVSSYLKDHDDAEIVLENLCYSPFAFGVNKENTALLDELNAFIAELWRTNDPIGIYNRWLREVDDGRIGERYDAPDAKVLRVGSSCTAVPSCFIADGKYEGVDFEVLNLFCKARGYRLEVSEMPFSSLIPALETNKIDLIANSLSPTDERRKAINFTEPYGATYSVLLRKKELNPVFAGGAAQEKIGLFAQLKQTAHNNLVLEGRYKLVLAGLWLTIVIAITSIFFGTIWGGVLCYFNMSRSKVMKKFARVYIDIMRGMPVLVILMINFYVVFASTSLSASIIAIISFAMYFGAYVSEMFRTGIEGVDKGQTEAGLAIGFSKIETFIYIVAPQAARRIMPVYMGDAISTFKTTSVVGYIAVQDLTKVGDIIRSRTFDAFFPLIVVAILYFIASYVFAYLLQKLADKTIYNH